MAKKKPKAKSTKAKKATKKVAKKSMKKATKKAAKKTSANTSKKAAKKATKKAAKKAAPQKAAAKPKMAKAVTTTTGLKTGDRAPNFTRPATGGQSISLSDLAGKKVVLYFYPKDDTPGCTLEGQDFTRLNDKFKDKNTVVLGVSRDDVACHEKFKSKYSYAIDLLADEDETLSNAFGVMKDKNMYGKMVRGIERSTFVIDPNGVIVKEWRGVSVPGHAEEVLNFVSNL